MSNIRQTIREYILDNLLMGGTADQIKENTSLLEIGALDSTGVIELVSFLEKAFGITVADEEMVPDNLDSLSNMERYVSLKLKTGNRAAE